MAQIDDRINQHYLLEKELAQRILESPQEHRTQITVDTYNELFSKIPWHPQLQINEKAQKARLAEKWLIYGFLINPNSTILDIGAGDAMWTRYLVEKTSSRCVGIDVSEKIMCRLPGDHPNLELYIMDATALAFTNGSFDIVFSSQLIEHLHPKDVELHFNSVYRVMRGGGLYAFDTPNRLTGPHDISKYFDDVATGFHLKEWTYKELNYLLRQSGFKRIQTIVTPWDLVKHIPLLRTLGIVPASLVVPGETLAASIKNKKNPYYPKQNYASYPHIHHRQKIAAHVIAPKPQRFMSHYKLCA